MKRECFAIGCMQNYRNGSRNGSISPKQDANKFVRATLGKSASEFFTIADNSLESGDAASNVASGPLFAIITDGDDV